MKTLPDNKELVKMLAELKDAEQQAREICQISTNIALKYQEKIETLKKRK